jgi:hypothetical protein
MPTLTGRKALGRLPEGGGDGPEDAGDTAIPHPR